MTAYCAATPSGTVSEAEPEETEPDPEPEAADPLPEPVPPRFLTSAPSSPPQPVARRARAATVSAATVLRMIPVLTLDIEVRLA